MRRLESNHKNAAIEALFKSQHFQFLHVSPILD